MGFPGTLKKKVAHPVVDVVPVMCATSCLLMDRPLPTIERQKKKCPYWSLQNDLPTFDICIRTGTDEFTGYNFPMLLGVTGEQFKRFFLSLYSDIVKTPTQLRGKLLVERFYGAGSHSRGEDSKIAL